MLNLLPSSLFHTLLVLKWEWVYDEVVRVGGCAWGLVAPGLGRLKPDTTRSSHMDCLASDFSTFHLISTIIYIPSLGVKVQSDAHLFEPGHYKTWTVDYGLDCGLDYGLGFSH